MAKVWENIMSSIKFYSRENSTNRVVEAATPVCVLLQSQLKDSIRFGIELNEEGKQRLLEENKIAGRVVIDLPIEGLSKEVKALLSIIYKGHYETVLDVEKKYNILTVPELVKELENMYSQWRATLLFNSRPSGCGHRWDC